MPEEVTYTTLKFTNLSKANELKKTVKKKTLDMKNSLDIDSKESDNNEVPELELVGGAETGAESTAEVAESRAVREHRARSRMWCSIAVILLVLNLVVLAGLGTLGLMYNQEFIQFNNKTAYKTQRIIEQLEKNLSLYMDMYENVSSEHIILKNMSENTLRMFNNLASKYCEDLKQKWKEVEIKLCPQSWFWHGDSCYYFSTEPKTFQESDNDCRNNNSFLMRIGNEENWNRTQLFVRCLPSPRSWLNLTCAFNEKNQTAQKGSEFCSDLLNIPINISSVETVRYGIFNGTEIIGSSNESNNYYICEKKVPVTNFQFQNNASAYCYNHTISQEKEHSR